MILETERLYLRKLIDDGFGLWGVILKENGKMIGQCGLTLSKSSYKKWNEEKRCYNKALL